LVGLLLTQQIIGLVSFTHCRTNFTFKTKQNEYINHTTKNNHCRLTANLTRYQILFRLNSTRNPAIAEGPRDAGVPVEIW